MKGYGLGEGHRIWYSPHYSNLFIYKLSKKPAPVQLFDRLLSLDLRSQTLETNSHFTTELLLCALGDLTIRDLAYWNVRAQTSFPYGNFSSIYLFFFKTLVQGLLVLGYCHSPYVTFWVLHVAPAFQELARQTIISFIGSSQGIRLKDLWTSDLPPFH